MVDRLRVLLEEPLDPRVGRAILAFASAILLGLAALFVLAAGESDRPYPQAARPVATSPAGSSVPSESTVVEAPTHRPALRRQDPQDEKGSAAARRAERAMSSHRALQHVPYRSGELEIVLVGARGRRAVLRASAGTARAARQGWRRFLHRYRDSGRAYIPIFINATRSARSRGGA